MTSDRLAAYLDQMHAAALQARAFADGMTLEQFVADTRTQMAVGMALVLIGESATRIMAGYPDFPNEHPEIPWVKMKGMRNFVVHDYYELELPVVLTTVQTSIPDLLFHLESLRNLHSQGE
ncbi:HepT-like ribonuclease domain-containing protein [Aliirhizobium smilacinae]|uniref:DUF86 domain-containing protein n=1 Tax=Aliirhizobium smilacinae TaxID=1395944 RepID=A0A5C4XHH0_9HYPH|nr:HepT-like ribonuclease domain-containing protein [Rhizobium smilacinae]TNM62857.1 DUF86 domain-containing protein [Rhizobium smilacinae]